MLGALGAVILEHVAGTPFAEMLGLPKAPVLFGALIMLKKPLLIPGVFAYVLVIYALPLAIVGRLCALPGKLRGKPNASIFQGLFRSGSHGSVVCGFARLGGFERLSPVDVEIYPHCRDADAQSQCH